MRLREELKVIASGALGGAIGTSLVLLMSLHIPAPDRSGDWATWVQAIGGIAALLVGVAAFTWPEHQRRGEERQNAVYVTLDVLQLLRRLPEELTSPNPYRPYGMQLEWLLDVIEVNIRWVDRVPFQYLRLGAEDDDVYFTSVYLHWAKKELEELIQLQVPRE